METRVVNKGQISELLDKLAKDYTLFALVDGKVEFSTKGPKKRRTVSIVAAE